MLSRFRVYLHLFLNEASSHVAYRFNTFLGMASRIVFIFVQFAIWRALYGGRDAVQTGFGSVSLREMTTYVVLTTALSFLIDAYVIERIDQRIKSGEIAIDFIRPISHLLSHLAAAWGQTLYGVAVQLVPMVILVAVVTGLQPPPTVQAGLLALALVPGASLLLFLMSYVLGLVGFWHSSVWQLGSLLYHAAQPVLWIVHSVVVLPGLAAGRLRVPALPAALLRSVGNVAGKDRCRGRGVADRLAVGVDRRAAGAAAGAVAGRHSQGRGAGRVRQ